MEKQLKKFRAKIDAIDEKLIELLAKRSMIIGEVKELKKDLHPKLRISRETLQAHKLQKKDFGLYKHETMQKVWRELIFASLCIEGDLNIEVYNDKEGISPLWVLTRDHFGTYANITTSNSLDNIFNNLNRNITTLAVVPFPEDFEILWDDLVKNPDIKICLSLPFLTTPNNIKSEKGLVIGKARLEESEQDVSLFIVKNANINPKPNVKILLSKNNSHLVLVNGFTQDRALVGDFTNTPISDVIYLGSYPKPLTA